jgi:fumarate reductase flavoprotein subunit
MIVMRSAKIPKFRSVEPQIVIIGGGGAGLAAAVTAAVKGGKVVVVEKRRISGGNTNLANVMFGAETPFQKRMKIDVPRDFAFKLAMGYAHWKMDPRIVRAFIDKSGDTIRWLEEKGIEFEYMPNYYPEQVPRAFQIMKGGGVAMTRALSKECKDLGVQFLYQTMARKILMNKKREVRGVLVVTKQKEMMIPSKSVIVATGGYAGNKALMKKYCPAYSEDLVQFGLPINVGDGLRMAVGAGAATEGLGLLQLIGPRFATSSYIAAIVVEPNTIWLNKRGERFVDESLSFRWPEAANALARQPDKICYNMFDEKIKQIFMNEGVSRGWIKYPTGTKMTELDKEIRAQLSKGEIKISDSWEEIAKWMSVVPQVLKATIDEYNVFCDQKYDPTFAKDPRFLIPVRTPPFYALKCHQGFHGTVGGIKINQRMEVLDKDDQPIHGLYAAGSDTGGWQGDTYCLDLSGSTFAFAVSSGRIAGENAFKYALGE